MKFIDEIDSEKHIKNKRIILRVDFNVPIDYRGLIADDSRIKEAIPTINYILEKKPRQLIIISHLGRPDGEKIHKYSMEKVAKALEKIINKQVYFIDDCLKNIPDDKNIVFLENLRFYNEEKKDNENFAKKLAEKADLYVNDGFAVCHRKHASVHSITKFIPGTAGLLIKKELSVLNEKWEKPVVMIMGGSKLSTKLNLIRNIINKYDNVLLGGAMIFTFYKSMNQEIGNSLYEKDYLMDAKLMKNNPKLILPKDIVICEDDMGKGEIKTVTADNMPEGWIGLDLGEKTIKDYRKNLKIAKTVIWNGPLVKFEIEKFINSTLKTAEFLVKNKKKVIIGGGDTIKALEKYKDKFYYASTGGGSFLSYLSGKELPALKALDENEVEFFL